MKKKMQRKIISVVAIVLLLSLNVTATVLANGKKTNDTSQMEIAMIISEDPSLSTLAAAIKAADLTSTLEGKGPYTVFAPTDDAFKKMPEGILPELLKPENKEKLADLLLYHVYPGVISSDDVTKLVGKDITMADNKTATISEKDGSYYINDAKIVMKDIQAKNGIIHVIDAVLDSER